MVISVVYLRNEALIRQKNVNRMISTPTITSCCTPTVLSSTPIDMGKPATGVAVVMGALAIGRIPYERWLRFMWPLLVILTVIIMASLSIAAIIV